MAEYKGTDAFLPIDASVTDTFAPPENTETLPHVTLTPQDCLTLLETGRLEKPLTAHDDAQDAPARSDVNHTHYRNRRPYRGGSDRLRWYKVRMFGMHGGAYV